MSMDVLGLGQTDIGLRRPNNEDAFVVDAELGLFVVCDGMGGHAGGEVAAKLATSTIVRIVRDQSDVITRVAHDPTLSGELISIVSNAVSLACREIYDRATSDPALAGMGCTATVVLVVGQEAAMAHVGDTRLYLVRSGSAHQLSSDHTLAAEMVRKGMLAPEHVAGHSQSHILTKALGPQALVDIETLSFEVSPGDTLVLCSDGLGDYIPSSAWLAEQVERTPVEELPDVLIEFANASGGRDNSTAIVVTVTGPGGDGEFPRRSPQFALDILGSSFLFSKLTLAQLSHVLSRCDARTHEAREIIRQQGDIHDELLVMVSGTLEVSRQGGPRAVVGPGQHLGERLVLRPRPARARIMSLERSHLLALNGLNLTDLSSRRPWLGVDLLSRLVERLSADLDHSMPGGAQAAQDLASDLL